jgi:excisionase family DNA binding protein
MHEENIFKEKLFTITEIAALMGVSYTLARILIHKNNVKLVRIGNQILVPEGEVQRLMELRKQKIINKIRVRGER